jgi:pimeloyl-ACP methyl ester carboxylesterase
MMSVRASHVGPRLGPASGHVAELRGLWASPLVGPAAAVGVAVVVALLSAQFMPRGPVTAGQGLVAMVSGLALGLVAGFAWPSRAAGLLALLAYMAAFELGRLGAIGPTVDWIRLDNTFGILALVLGRGLHGLLVFVPLVLGSRVGRALATRLTASEPSGPFTRRRWMTGDSILLGFETLLTVGLAVLVAWPASTPPILGDDGKPVPGSIAELATVRLGGEDQVVMIRAANPDKPVLLYLSGGPGQSDLALARALSSGWTKDFVVADWDQRGNGKSYAAFEPASTLTLDQAVSDTIELTDYLRTRFAEQKIYLMGESWGTILGVLAVQRRPDLYYAWLGSGQMVNLVETDRRIYHDLVAHATRTGDSGLLAKLQEIGEPPYRDLPWSNASVMLWYDYLYADYTPSDGYRARGESSGLDSFGLLGSEYNVIEKANVLRGLMDTFAILYPQLYGIDFRRDVPRLEVPVYLLDGAAELKGRRDLAIEWFDGLQAPTRLRVTFAGAAHSVAFEQADAVQQLLNDTIVPATYGK